LSDTYKDRVGREVKVGDVVAYATTEGRRPRLRIGKVTFIERREEVFAIRVRGVDEEPWDSDEPRLNKSVANLHDPDRTLKLDTVPEPHARLLEGVK